jgi:hypothetical protein
LTTEIILLGISINDNDEHLSRQDLPIEVTLLGIIRDDNDEYTSKQD